MKQRKWQSLLVMSMFLPACVMGAGFQLYTEGSAEALGQGAAVSARDDQLSQAWYNPAALAGQETSGIMAGATFVQILADFESSLGDSSMEDTWRVIPHLYYVQALSSNWTATVSVNAPYGLITEWPDDWVGNGIATYSKMQTIYTTPSIAYRINDQLRVAAGVNVVYAEAELSSISSDLGYAAEKTMSGDDLGYGGSFSVYYEPLEDWSIGARCQSRVDLTMDGAVEVGPVSVDAAVDVTLPSSVNIGIANRSFRNLTLGLELLWTEWSTYDEVAVLTTTMPKDWDDVWSVRVGGEYQLSERWAVRGGYVWGPVAGSRYDALPGASRL